MELEPVENALQGLDALPLVLPRVAREMFHYRMHFASPS